MRIDPLLIRFVERLIDELGDLARDQRAGRLEAPLPDWSGRDVIAFVRRLRQATSDEFMGLGASSCPIGVTDFLIELSCRCDTLRDALSLGSRFLAIATKAASVELAEDGAEAELRFAASPTGHGSEQVLLDWLMIVWHKRSQWLIGAEIALDRSEFAHPLDAKYSSYAAMFGGECVFNAGRPRLVFARSYLDRRVVRTAADGEHMKSWMPGYFANPVGLSRTWRQMIKDVLRTEIARGESPSTVDDLADVFGVGGQTLRRRLKAEGASYRTLKAEVRREVALDVLADESATLSEASFAAGFAEPNALTRALKISQGISSAQLREQVRRWSAG